MVGVSFYSKKNLPNGIDNIRITIKKLRKIVWSIDFEYSFVSVANLQHLQHRDPTHNPITIHFKLSQNQVRVKLSTCADNP